MISVLDYTCVFLCIAFALVRLGHRVCHMPFPNDLPDLDSLVQIKNRDESSPNCSEVPCGLLTVFGDSAGDLENLTRTHDIWF